MKKGSLNINKRQDLKTSFETWGAIKCKFFTFLEAMIIGINYEVF